MRPRGAHHIPQKGTSTHVLSRHTDKTCVVGPSARCVLRAARCDGRAARRGCAVSRTPGPPPRWAGLRPRRGVAARAGSDAISARSAQRHVLRAQRLRRRAVRPPYLTPRLASLTSRHTSHVTHAAGQRYAGALWHRLSPACTSLTLLPVLSLHSSSQSLPRWWSCCSPRRRRGTPEAGGTSVRPFHALEADPHKKDVESTNGGLRARHFLVLLPGRRAFAHFLVEPAAKHKRCRKRCVRLESRGDRLRRQRAERSLAGRPNGAAAGLHRQRQRAHQLQRRRVAAAVRARRGRHAGAGRGEQQRRRRVGHRL